MRVAGSANQFGWACLPLPPLLPQIKALSDILIEKVKERRDPLLSHLVKTVVPNFTQADIGKEFELNVEDQNGPMVVVTNEPVAHKYPMIRSVADL